MRRFKIKLSTIAAFVLATALGASLFWVSQQVQMLEREQRGINEQISSEQEGMRVLNAEWDYLNRPDRIEALAAKYLNQMQPVVPDNLLRNANAVPEPQMMQGEDETPVMVSTGDDKKDATKDAAKNINTAPDSRPIHDREDSKSTDFDGVLKSTAGDDE
jgi:cell division protein FtsL